MPISLVWLTFLLLSSITKVWSQDTLYKDNGLLSEVRNNETSVIKYFCPHGLELRNIKYKNDSVLWLEDYKYSNHIYQKVEFEKPVSKELVSQLTKSFDTVNQILINHTIKIGADRDTLIATVHDRNQYVDFNSHDPFKSLRSLLIELNKICDSIKSARLMLFVQSLGINSALTFYSVKPHDFARIEVDPHGNQKTHVVEHYTVAPFARFKEKILHNEKLFETRDYQNSEKIVYYFKRRHDDGSIKISGKMSDEKPNGKWKYFNKNGQLYKEVIYKNGIAKKVKEY